MSIAYNKCDKISWVQQNNKLFDDEILKTEPLSICKTTNKPNKAFHHRPTAS